MDLTLFVFRIPFYFWSGTEQWPSQIVATPISRWVSIFSYKSWLLDFQAFSTFKLTAECLIHVIQPAKNLPYLQKFLFSAFKVFIDKCYSHVLSINHYQLQLIVNLQSSKCLSLHQSLKRRSKRYECLAQASFPRRIASWLRWWRANDRVHDDKVSSHENWCMARFLSLEI